MTGIKQKIDHDMLNLLRNKIENVTFHAYEDIHDMIGGVFNDANWLYKFMERNKDISRWNENRWAVDQHISKQYDDS